MIPALILCAIALAALLLLLFRDGGAREAEKTAKEARGRTRRDGEAPVPGSCALCGTRLARGESMRSDIFPGKGDRIMRIFGCPHCLGSRDERAARSCPVCHSELGPGDYAVARYFERPGRRHVHILGCTKCRGHQRR